MLAEADHQLGVIEQSLPCWPPGCRRPPVLTPMPYEGEHPGEAMQAAACCCRWRCAAAANRSRRGPPQGRNRLQCRRTPLSRSQHRQHSSSRNARASSHIGSGEAKKEHCANPWKTRVKPIIEPGSLRQEARAGREGHQARSHGCETQPGTGAADTGGRAGEWIKWCRCGSEKTHEMRLMVLCHQVARAC